MITAPTLLRTEPNPKAGAPSERNRRKYHFSVSSFFQLFFPGDSKRDEEENLPARVRRTNTLPKLALHALWTQTFFSSSSFLYFHLIFIRHKCLDIFSSWCVSFTRPFFSRFIISVFLRELLEMVAMERDPNMRDRWALWGGNIDKKRKKELSKWKLADGNIRYFRFRFLLPFDWRGKET